MVKKIWKCGVCDYEFSGDKPPSKCPHCASSSEEFYEKDDGFKLEYNNEKLDVLVINGSNHAYHNTGIAVKLIENELKLKKAKYRIINLNQIKVKGCWCCYSNGDEECTYPCRNQFDDVPILHRMIVNSKSVIIASSINWNNMPGRLKNFLDRLTCLQNINTLGKKSLTVGKTIGIFVNGHEDGAMKTCSDIFLYFEEMGFISAPFCYGYRTHGAENNANSDNNFFKKDEKLRKSIKGLVNNVLVMGELDLENKLRGKIKSVSE
jgi:multimeric flavodoxin WrbA/rubredoxin